MGFVEVPGMAMLFMSGIRCLSASAINRIVALGTISMLARRFPERILQSLQNMSKRKRSSNLGGAITVIMAPRKNWRIYMYSALGQGGLK